MSDWFDVDSGAALQLLKTDADQGLSEKRRLGAWLKPTVRMN